MTLRNTSARWGAISQLLHWLIVALIVLQAALGLTGRLLPLGVEKLALLARHKSIGMTILGLATLRLLWRWLNPVPPLPSNLKPHERFLAHSTHASLYVLLFAMPLSGWIMSSARGFPVSWFGLYQLPDLVPKSRPLYEAMVTTHAALAIALALTVTLHVAGALKHHYVLKDDTLRRMLPSGRLPLAVAALAMLMPAPARAAAQTFTLAPAKSALTYEFTQAGARNQGRFGSFAVRFAPAAGRLEVVVDMRSLDTGDPQRNATLAGKDFFDIAQYPQSRFSASRLQKTATGYEAVGALTLRGVTRSIAIPFTWHTANTQGQVVGYLGGEVTLHRLDFGVGQGQWQSTDWVGNDVTVRYSLMLTAVR